MLVEETKKPWSSKTLWVNLLVSLGVLLPWEPIRELLSEQNIVLILSVINIGLRLVTQGKISLS